MTPSQRHFATDLQHFAEEEKIKGAVVPPIFQNSLFVFDEYEQFAHTLTENQIGPPYIYSRVSNPTLDVLERKIAHLEKCESAKVFGSGMAAISCAIMSCIKSGSHVVSVDTCYSVTRMMLDKYLLPKFDITATYVEGSCADEFIDAIKPETACIYLESPSTMLFKLQDIEKITKAAREKKIPTLFDNSYSSPVYQNPAEMGVDLVLHSATKYLGGHSDLTAGVVCGSSERMRNLILDEASIFGSAIAPLPAWLLHRGLRTLQIRIKAHEEAGNIVAGWLESHKDVERVHHVGLESHPQRELFLKQMRGSTGLFSFEPRRQDRPYIVRFMDSLRIFQKGVSWGGFESLCVPTFLQPIDYAEPKFVIRLYCGLEDPRDLMADIQGAFEEAAKEPG